MEGEFGEAVHFVMEGKVKSTKPGGRQEHYYILQFRVDIFAEVILFNEELPGGTEVWKRPELPVIRNEDLEKVLKAHTSWSSIIKVLNKRLWMLSSR